jgi:hypothetical protein
MSKHYTLVIIHALLTLRGASQCATYTVPHYEPFAVTVNNTLPACWAATNFSNATLTFSTGFAAYSMSATGTNFFVSPGFQLSTGVVYSVSVWHRVNQQVSSTAPSIELLLGTSQSTTGMSSLSAGASSSIYSALSATFSVVSAGSYYIGIKSTVSQATTALQELDDFRIVIPCSIAANQPSVAVSPNNATICSGTSITFTATGADTYTWSNGSNADTTTYSPSSPMQISVVGTRSLTGCVNQTNVTLAVKPSPAISVFALPPVACKGELVSLQASGAASYSWAEFTGTSSVQQFPLNGSATFTVIGTAANGCTGSAVTSVSMAPSPTVDIFPPSETICPGGKVTFNASGASGYSWFGLPGAGSSVTVMPTQTTTYNVVGTNQEGCKDTASAVVIVDPCLTIAENHLQSFRVYPVPAHGQITVEGTYDRLELRDATGRVLSTNFGTREIISIDVSSLPPGIYFLAGYNGHKSHIIKMCKE